MALSSGCAQEPKAGPLIARRVLFGNPDKVSLKVSPDGRRISFLAEHLGGRFEPIGSDFEGSGIEVPTGAEYVPTLKENTPDRSTEANDA